VQLCARVTVSASSCAGYNRASRACSRRYRSPLGYKCQPASAMGCEPYGGQRILQPAPLAHVHVNITTRDERQPELMAKRLECAQPVFSSCGYPGNTPPPEGRGACASSKLQDKVVIAVELSTRHRQTAAAHTETFGHELGLALVASVMFTCTCASGAGCRMR